MNLTYEVRDGVVCHYGEGNEQGIQPNRRKRIKSVKPVHARKQNPATLEACVVRMSDRIAYLGRDFEDAVEAEIISQGDLPRDAAETLGNSNSQIVRVLVHDVIEASKGLDRIQFSDALFPYYMKLKNFNDEKIYKSTKLTTQYERILLILRDLFGLFYEVTQETDCGRRKRNRYDGYMYEVFFEFLDDMEYPDEVPDAQRVSDFVAGMTDSFAMRAFEELFLISSPV